MAAVADLVSQDVLGLGVVSLGFGDAGEVDAGYFLFGGCEEGGLGGESGLVVVAGVQCMGGDGVSDVDDGSSEVVVQPVAFVEPGPAVGAALVEGLSLDQAQGGDEVVDAVGAAGLSSGAQASEEVRVDEEVEYLVGAHPRCLGGWGLSGVGQVVVAGAGVGAEPGAHDSGVVAGLAQGDAQGVGELFGGGTVRPGGDVGQDLGHVGFAVDQGRATCTRSHGSEEGEPG